VCHVPSAVLAPDSPGLMTSVPSWPMSTFTGGPDGVAAPVAIVQVTGPLTAAGPVESCQRTCSPVPASCVLTVLGTL
jgi:hypothetical protein